MTYEDWAEQIPGEIENDPLWNMEAYRLALFLHDLAWEDCAQMMKDRRGRAIAEQMIRSTGSIGANIEEGYGRGFGKPFALPSQITALLVVAHNQQKKYRSKGQP